MKFFALAIMSDMTLKRFWMDSTMAISFLKENKGSKLYRSEQEAVLVSSDEGVETVLWQDIAQQDYKVG